MQKKYDCELVNEPDTRGNHHWGMVIWLDTADEKVAKEKSARIIERANKGCLSNDSQDGNPPV